MKAYDIRMFIIQLIIMSGFMFDACHYAQADDRSKRNNPLQGKLITIPDMVTHAKVILMASVHTERPLSEDRLISQGCLFETSDPGRIDELKKILINSKIREAKHGLDVRGIDLREGVYLTVSNETEIKLLFGRDCNHTYENCNQTDVSFTQLPEIKEQPAIGVKEIQEMLFYWAKNTAKPVATNERDQAGCDCYMSKEFNAPFCVW